MPGAHASEAPANAASGSTSAGASTPRANPAAAAIGALAAGLAHEINTPIQFIGDNAAFLRDALADVRGISTAVRALLAAAEREGVLVAERAAVADAVAAADLEFLEDNVPDAVERMIEGIAHVAEIVSALKAFSHPSGGDLHAVDLNELVTSALTLARNEYKYVAEIVTHHAPLPRVVGPPTELQKVLLNLLVNAAHAIAETGTHGRITVTTGATADHVEVAVADTGGGIPEHVRDHIFQPFFTTKPVGRGTGQGLAIAHTVVAALGGSLTFETEVGVGTTFRMRLPLGAHPRHASVPRTQRTVRPC